MNPLQAMNSAASFAIFSALIAGVVRMFAPVDDVTMSVLSARIDDFLLAIFIVLFRIKVHFEDHRYFAESNRDIHELKYVGVVLAVMVWISMAVSAGLVDHPKVSAWFLVLSLIISTLWILSHVGELVATKAEQKATITQRLQWAAFNMAYILILLLYQFVSESQNKWVVGHRQISQNSAMILMLVVLAFESLQSKQLRGFLGIST